MLDHFVNGEEVEKANWMRYINRIDQTDLQNLEAFQKGFKVYYRAIRDIPPCTELLVWYSSDYNQDYIGLVFVNSYFFTRYF